MLFKSFNTIVELNIERYSGWGIGRIRASTDNGFPRKTYLWGTKSIPFYV